MFRERFPEHSWEDTLAHASADSPSAERATGSTPQAAQASPAILATRSHRAAAASSTRRSPTNDSEGSRRGGRRRGRDAAEARGDAMGAQFLTWMTQDTDFPCVVLLEEQQGEEVLVAAMVCHCMQLSNYIELLYLASVSRCRGFGRLLACFAALWSLQRGHAKMLVGVSGAGSAYWARPGLVRWRPRRCFARL